MSTFPSDIKFKYPWRSYQERVLCDLERHLEDDHLHVIAPPGSGKTVLGLEVMLRIGNPTLILAPTLAIRQQWIDRFCELFLQQSEVPEWISRDIRKPGWITVATYQGVHAACNNRHEEEINVDFVHETDVVERRKSNFRHVDKIVEGLRDVGVRTIIVDEAHHLKNEWWQTLSRIKNKLNPKIVGLTATPPYDVTPAEWMRYVELNGPVDAEISVPELIKAGDLCPHQDYIYLCAVDPIVQKEIVDFRHKSQLVYEQLLADDTLMEVIQSLPFWTQLSSYEYFIFENIGRYAACLIYLHARGWDIPPVHYALLGVDIEQKILPDMPSLDQVWMQELLNFYLFDESGMVGEEFKEHRERIAAKLRRIGVLERKTIQFDQNKRLEQHLASSIHKLEAIADIVGFEYGRLGASLRQVILCDFIRKEFMSTERTNDLPLTKIGVLSIFEQLRRDDPDHTKKLAVLTGSLVILPISALAKLQVLTSFFDLPDVLTKPLPYDTNYIEVVAGDRTKDRLIALVTSLFQDGEIEILIGTKSLLGEGWDAPAINSLVLASFVGSFVLSNQMRGRAIRTQKGNPGKCSAIWHIAAIDPTQRYGGMDLASLRRRFRNFVGLSNLNGGIENGLSRLALPEYFDADRVDQHNQQVFRDAAENHLLGERWHGAIGKGMQLVEEVKIPFFEEKVYAKAKAAQMQKYVGNMVATLGSGILFYLETSTQVFGRFVKVFPNQLASYGMMAMFGVGAVMYGRTAFRTFGYYARYRDISKDIYHVGQALLRTVCKAKIFATSYENLKVLTYSDGNGAVFCHLDGGTAFERSLFIQMIQEIVDPVHEPRYIVVRKSNVLKYIQQKDFHAVPEILGKKAALAQDFLIFWREYVGPAELHFTRSYTGRQILLHSRVFAMANTFSDDRSVQAVNIWR